MIRSFALGDEAEVIALWRACGLVRPWNDPVRDILRKRAVQPELFLVAERDGGLIGTAMAGYDGHRGWVNYLAVAPEHQGRGIGRALLAAVEARLVALGCPKVNVQIRADNALAQGFYTRLGYRRDEVVSFGKRLLRDDLEHADVNGGMNGNRGDAGESDTDDDEDDIER